MAHMIGKNFSQNSKTLIENYQFGNFRSQLFLYPLAEVTENADFVVADSNTAKLFDVSPDLILLPGESNKTLAQLEIIIEAFVVKNLTRNSTVLAFGGGLLCDLVGFAVASYMRGCGLILVPTTLLSMVDAGLGGKTGCNFQNYKNLVGAFYPAREVRLVPQVLSSLPVRHFRSGLAELLKHALISDTEFLLLNLQEQQNKLQPPILKAQTKTAALELSTLIIEGIRVKGRIVERDLYEKGERAFLNLGHTYAHALEKISDFSCTHGEAVAWGINQALHLSATLNYCREDYAMEIRKMLASMGFILELRELCPHLFQQSKNAAVAEMLVAAMALDKKRQQSGICLVLQRGRGQTFLQELPSKLIIKNLQL